LPAAFPSAERFTVAFALLHDLHYSRAQLSPPHWCTKSFARTHLLPLFASTHGVQRVANRLELIDTARVLSGQGIQAGCAQPFSCAQQEVEKKSSPRLSKSMTPHALADIHRAKGLEFRCDFSRPRSITAPVKPDRYLSTCRRESGVANWPAGLDMHYPRMAESEGRNRHEMRRKSDDCGRAATVCADHLVIPVLSSAQRRGRGEQWVFADESLAVF